MLLLLAVGALAFAGCSSTPSKVSTGPIRASTFSFINTGSKPAPSFANNEQAVHATIQDAITKAMNAIASQNSPATGQRLCVCAFNV